MSKYSELADRLDAAREPVHAVVAWEAGSALRELEAENAKLTATVNGLAAERNALQRELHIARTKLEQTGRGDEPQEASRPK